MNAHEIGVKQKWRSGRGLPATRSSGEERAFRKRRIGGDVQDLCTPA